MPLPGGTLVQRLPHMSHASAGLRQLYERVESGTLPTVPVNGRTARNKTVRYPHVKRIGPYLLGKNIGEGSFAKVKEALHSVVGEKVAIKVIDKKVVREDPYLRKNMRREANLLQSLRHHPNIISLYEVMETDNNFYMVLDLCTGGALLDRICSSKCLPEDEARRYVRQIVSAVDHIHQAGILHRDLKVENLLLDDNNNIKIIDFGLSNYFIGNGTSSHKGGVRAGFCATQCGSPAYAAPEIIANKKYGAKVDVWSIGVNTFAMLAGSLPFTVEPFNIKLLLKKINNREMAEIPANLSKDCKDFIRKLLNPDPRQRYSIIETMNHPWIAVNKGTNITPRTAIPSPSGRLSRMELDTDILEYIWSNMGYNISHVTDSIITKRSDEYSAIYYLLLRKRERQQMKMLRQLKSTTDAKDGGISGPKLYNEATAMELAGRKHGSLHFKMALLLQQEKENDTANDIDSGVEKSVMECTDNIENKTNIMTSSDKLGNPLAPRKHTYDYQNDFQNETKTSNIQHKNYQRSLKTNVEKRKTIKPNAMETKKLRDEWNETSKKVTNSILDHYGTPVETKIYKLSTAHRVNLTFRQSDVPTDNFVGHFNYRRRDTGNTMREILTTTRTTNQTICTKVVPISTWRQSDSVDSISLKNRLDSLQITPRKEDTAKDTNNHLGKDQAETCNIQPSTHVQKKAIAKYRNTKDSQPVPPEFASLIKRRHIKVANRKSIDNISLSSRKRVTRIRKGSLSGSKLVARFPGRPKTPVVALPQAGLKRKVSTLPANQKRKQSCDRNRGLQCKKSSTRKGSPSSENIGSPHKCEIDNSAGRETRQGVPSLQVMPGAAPPPSKLSVKRSPPKMNSTIRRPVFNEVSAESDV